MKVTGASSPQIAAARNGTERVSQTRPVPRPPPRPGPDPTNTFEGVGRASTPFYSACARVRAGRARTLAGAGRGRSRERAHREGVECRPNGVVRSGERPHFVAGSDAEGCMARTCRCATRRATRASARAAERWTERSRSRDSQVSRKTRPGLAMARPRFRRCVRRGPTRHHAPPRAPETIRLVSADLHHHRPGSGHARVGAVPGIGADDD